ncbi:OprO/OprP family phosphate-selective porin [Sphingomicrobium aestuariivivum]|uniref:OprO/OprP family phosphate-selective porin n=1 Tax=Sphingomicrobium aestuariivivum TaxID=1582356 RepID=UPI001FD68B38|nr:porin [Sphingomicrobium aestuariivivum]MCJ8191341.1 OprO/OprP family phosphate-selective porin [Sphingomicrobium aestuariivivum]
MAKLITTAPLALGIALAANPAHAQDITTEEAQAMLERLEALEAESAELRARLTAAEAAAAEATAVAAAAQADTTAVQAEVEVAKEEAAKTPTISSFKKADGFTLKPRGRLQFDMGGVGAPDAIDEDGLGNSTEVRRARLGVSGDLPGDFGYKFELDFADSEVAFTDALVTYETGDATFTLGQHNNFQGLEEITSSNDISFMERAAFTDAFGFERRLGVSAEYGAGDLTVWGGVFSSNISDLGDDGEQGYSFDTRAVFSPSVGDAQLHFGGSLHWRDLDNDGRSVRYRQRPQLHVTDVRFLNTGSLPTYTELNYGLEAAALFDRFHIAAEGHWMKPDVIFGEDPTFFGGYAEIGYVFTPGYERGYSGGKFKGVAPVKNGSWSGFGALSGNLRYDRLDLSDNGIVGGTQDAIMASLSWSPNAYMRFLVNYANIAYEDAAISAAGDRDYDVDVVGARAQFAF